MRWPSPATRVRWKTPVALPFLLFLICDKFPVYALAKDVQEQYSLHFLQTAAQSKYSIVNEDHIASILEEELLGSLVRQEDNGPSFLVNSRDSLVTMTNGEAEEQVFFTFKPAENQTIDDYQLSPVIGNADILNETDISIFYTEDFSRGILAYNVTVDLDFNKWVGITSIGLQALNATTAASEVLSSTIQIIVVGITLFGDFGSSGRGLVGGPNYPLILSVAEPLSEFYLNVFIQYADGSNSNETLTLSPANAGISTTDLDDQVIYSSSCSQSIGIFDGSDVALPGDCGIGFSTNEIGGDYVGPKFGIDFIPYQNGSFITSFEWNDLVVGSDLELEGFGTYIDVSLFGEVPPLVTHISPNGPFQISGTDDVTVNVENLPQGSEQLELWSSSLSILFADETRNAGFLDGNSVFFGNGTVSLMFTLPAGSGSDLPWVLTVTKPDGAQLTAIDLTNPPYLFTLQSTLFIDEILPSSGPEEGGTVVSLIGEFADVGLSNVTVFFGDFALDSELISSVTTTNITFEVPSRQAAGADFNVSVTATLNNQNSNSVVFTYLPGVQLESLSPSSGPVEGGTEVTIIGNFDGFEQFSDTSGIYFGETQIDASLIQTVNSTTIVFLTPPHSALGDPSLYIYDVSLVVSGISSNPLPFAYESPLEITSMEPDSGDEAGGTVISLTGFFASYVPATSAVFFGGKEISAADVVHNDTVIQFSSPPRLEIGNAYSYDIWVAVGIQESNRVTFTFEDIGSSTFIDVSGCSIDSETGVCVVGACADTTYRAKTSVGVKTQNPTYNWTLVVEGSSINLLAARNIVSDAEVLYLPYTIFQGQGTSHILILTIETDFSSFQTNFQLRYSVSQSIGVKISDPQARSKSDPNVTLTIPAEIGLPGCNRGEFSANLTEISYIWGFRSSVYVFSHLNKTAPEDEVSPTLLGREFHIPQPLMEYGAFRLTLTAFFTQQETIRGSDSTTVMIEPAPLMAQINGGELTQFVSGNQDFIMSALQSSDPDVLSGDASEDLTYTWSCRYAWDGSMSDALPCDNNLLSTSVFSASIFTISSGSFDSVRNSTSEVHIEYILQVAKTSVNATGSDLFRSSDPVRTTLILVRESSQTFEALDQVAITNNQSAVIDRRRVKYYEDLTITPISETDETTWAFELISPSSQSRTLLASDANLLTLPGYFSVGMQAGRVSLGLKANVLSPNTEYIFLVSTFRTNFDANEQKIAFTTVEKPEVFLSGISTPIGTVNDTFALSAYTSYEGSFKFFFMLTDDFGFQSCVGGCQGEDFVKFRLATAGNYNVRCDIYDWLGFALLASANGGNITVTLPSDSDISMAILAVDAEDAFLAGDHSDYQQLGADMVKYIWSNGQSLNPENDSEIFSDFVQGMNQVAANAVPNAIQSAAYVRVAAALASLTPELGITYETESLYYLVNITISAVERVPDNGALQQLEELLDFYDLTPSLILATFSEGTSRRRLLQEPQDVETEVRAIWLDLYEVMKEQLAVSVLKRCSCGCVEEIQTGLPSESQNSFGLRRAALRQSSNLPPAATYVNPAQGRLSLVKMKLAHFCNPEQGSSLVLQDNTAEEVRFAWCGGLFEDSIKKLYFALAQTPDYVYMSQVRRNVTLSNGLVSTLISTLDGNTMLDATLPIDSCYTVTMPIPRNLTEGVSDTSSGDFAPLGIMLAPKKAWGRNETEGLYAPVFDGIDTVISDSESTKDSGYTTASLQLSATGVLAVATRFAWPGGSAFSLEGIFVTAIEVTAITLVIFFLILMATLSAWLIATRLSAVTGVTPPVEVDFTYVERDVYGRGTAIDMMDDQESYPRREDAGT